MITRGPPVEYPPLVIKPLLITIVVWEDVPSDMTLPVLIISMPVLPVIIPPLFILPPLTIILPPVDELSLRMVPPVMISVSPLD